MHKTGCFPVEKFQAHIKILELRMTTTTHQDLKCVNKRSLVSKWNEWQKWVILVNTCESDMLQIVRLVILWHLHFVFI